MRRLLLAEAIGTFCLVFAGCGAIGANAFSQGALGHVGVSVVFGLVVLAMIYAIGNVSGAHINPAITWGFFLARRISWKRAIGYAVAQCAGALSASGVLVLLLPAGLPVGMTQPAEGVMVWQAVGWEVALTAVLMFVVLNVSTGHMEKGIMAGVAVGGTVAWMALLAGPITGASMNPARSLGPAVVGGDVRDLWIYIVGPMLGASLAWPTCRILQGPACCPPNAESPMYGEGG